jgi:hypothetical protein
MHNYYSVSKALSHRLCCLLLLPLLPLLLLLRAAV